MARDTLTYASGNSASTTLSSTVTGSDTTFPLTSDTNFSAKSGEGMVIIDEGAAAEELAYATGKSGGSLTIPLANRGLEGGSAQGHSSGSSVKGIITAGMWNDVVDSLTNVLLKTTGAVDTTKVVTPTGTQTLTNKTISADDNTLTGLVSASSTDTLTNKRITKRVGTVASAAAPTINTDDVDMFIITAQTEAITSFTTNLSGTPTNGQTLWIVITGTASRAITWGASFEASLTPLPTTTSGTSRLDVAFVWNAATSKWRCVSYT